MKQVYYSDVSTTPPSLPATAQEGYPQDGTVSGNAQATVPGAYWFHMISSELENAITAGGLTPDASKLNQLADIIGSIRAATNAVSYLPQTLTAEQKRQARENIGANQVLDARDFGAVGDGTTDDTAALQAALDAAAGGGTLRLPGGTYSIKDCLFVRSGTELIGEPGTVIRKDFTIGASGAAAMASVRALSGESTIHNIVLRGIVFDGNATAHPAQAFDILVVSSSLPIYDIDVIDCVFKDVIDLHAIDISYTDRINIIRCKFLGFSNPGANPSEWASDKRESIQLDPGHDGDAFLTRNVRVEGCYFGASENYPAPTCGFGNHGYRNVSDRFENIVVCGNIFDNVIYAGVTMLCNKNVTMANNVVISKNNGVMIYARHNTSLNIKAISENIVIANNVFSVGTGVGIYAGISSGTDIASIDDVSNRNLNIHHNVIQGTRAMSFACAENVVVDSNQCVNSYISGAARNFQITNNNFYNPASAMFISAAFSAIAVAKNNSEFNRNWTISGNSFYNPPVRAIHVTKGGKKNIVVANNCIYDTMDASAASAVTVPYIALDSAGTQVALLGNVVFADNPRGFAYAMYTSVTSAIKDGNHYVINDAEHDAFQAQTQA